MHALRFSAAKVWANYLLAISAAVVVVIVLTWLWDRTVMVGGIGGIVAVTGMLLVGTIKRSGKQDPVLVVDEAGLEVSVLCPINAGRSDVSRGAIARSAEPSSGNARSS